MNSWYREGSSIPLQAPINRGGSKDRPTTSTLSITPQRDDDGAKYRCVVWNRAMPEGQSLETTVTLNVNCKYTASVSNQTTLAVGTSCSKFIAALFLCANTIESNVLCFISIFNSCSRTISPATSRNNEIRQSHFDNNMHGTPNG